ncbi:MAG: FtsW/RodA/SpoVE family cell cycle protein [Eubacteriales bacterium]|nr:FtsW/RodA/SpoVE family cell cycle protein [Eubacteriales bacterium]
MEHSHGSTSRSKPFFDWILLLLMYSMMLLGVLFVSVATYNPDISAELPLINKIMSSQSGRWQAIFTIASPVAVWFIVSIPYEKFRSYVRLFYYIIIFMLVMVLGSSAIRSVSGWFQLALGRMLQPSEFAKIALILMLARALSSSDIPMSTFKDSIRIMGIFALPAGITLLQGEAGSVIVMAVIFYTMIYFGGVNWKWLFGMAVLAGIGVAIIFGYGVISGSGSYRLLRILSFLDPQKYYNDAGYQILNSQEAIGSGGMNGIGLFITGSHSHLNFVPEDWTDFVFATIGEAVGFVGSSVIILIYFIMTFRMLYLARYTIDKFGRLIIIGVMAMMFFHVFQNIAMTIGIMPITGIPLPFLSYGGSNLLTNVIGVSLVLNVTKNRSVSMPNISINVDLANSIPRKRRNKRKKIFVNTSKE